MALSSSQFLADVVAVYTGCVNRGGAFCSGRLIAPGLVLTAGHVVDYPTREAPSRIWKIRPRTKDGAWAHPIASELLWRGQGDFDLALLQMSGDTKLTPALQPVFASYDLLAPIADVDVAGFPKAWFTRRESRVYRVRGSLRIAADDGRFTWSVPPADKPDDPHGWMGMSGAAVCHVGPDDKLYLLGVVQEVPRHFSGGQLEVTRLSRGFADTVFCDRLGSALGEEPRIVSSLGIRVSIEAGPMARVPVPSEQAPMNYVDRPELTNPLLAHLLSDDRAPKGRAMITAVRGLGGIGKTTVIRWLVWQPEVEKRSPNGRIWLTLGKEPKGDALTIINDWLSQLDPAFKAKATEEAARADLAELLQDRSLLFVIDDVWPQSAAVAKALMVPSPRSRILLTSRFRFSRLADVPVLRAEEFPLDEMNAVQGTALITRNLSQKLSEDEKLLAVRLWEAVGGHPLALELSVARVKEGRPWERLLADLTTEIARLETLEEPDDELITAPITDESRKKQKSVRASLLLSVRYIDRRFGQRLFAWLGIVAEDAIITPRMAATLWSVDEEAAHRHLRTFSDVGLLSTTNDVYHIHDLMRDLARKLLTAPETAREIPGFGLPLRDAMRQFLERYRVKTTNGLWHTLPEDGYIHDHLLQHFEQAGWQAELEKLLWEEGVDQLCGWYRARERFGQTAGFPADGRHVWNYADRVFADEAHRAEAIALQLHCALINASINSLSAGIPRPVLVGAVHCGLITWSGALAMVQHDPDAHSRFLAPFGLERNATSARAASDRRSLKRRAQHQ